MDTRTADREEVRAVLRDVLARLDAGEPVDLAGVAALASALAEAVGRGPAVAGDDAAHAPRVEEGPRRLVHDIRSASGTILTWTHLIRRGIPSEEAAHGMAVVERAVHRQLALVEQLAATHAPGAAAGGAIGTTAPPRAGASTDDPHDLAGVRILIVDDDADARESMRALLAARGAEVATAISAIDAFDVLQLGRPDVLICDIVMPDADGYALLRRVRAPDTGERGVIPAIAVTGRAEEGDRQRALGAGYQLHLTKPFDPDELIRAVRNLVGRA